MVGLLVNRWFTAIAMLGRRHMRWAQDFAFPLILAGTSALLAAGFAAAASADSEGAARVLPRAVAVSGGAHHTCALTEAGGVKCWGWNGNGQLGDGTTTDHLTPVRLNLRQVEAIAAGPGHTCASTAKAGLCWGDNYFGELGDGTTTDRSAPVVYALESGIAVINTGGYGHSCDVTRSGRARCWGLNGSGQLGDGTTTDHLTPELVIGLRSAVALAEGDLHTCALTESGGVKCWGWNQYGQLGDGTTTDRHSPTAVRATAIAAGYAHTCALIATVAIKCWGVNGDGQLGDGTTSQRNIAGFVRTFQHGGAVAIAAGNEHNCAVTESGGVKCWGRNQWGELGDGTTTDRLTPVRVRGFPVDPMGY